VAAIDHRIIDRRPVQHAAVNAAKLVRLQKEPALRDAIARCELVLADGQPVVWAARLLGHRVPERVAGIDLMEALFALAAERGYGVYLLGARPQVIAEAAARIQARFPSLRLAGYRHGYFTPEEEGEVVDAIANAGPDLLFVALETPAKELFVARLGERLAVPFVMGVGGALDVLAGARRRAPRWAQRAGLEWAFRLAQEPRRLLRRYLVGNTRFVWLVTRALVRGAVTGRR